MLEYILIDVLIINLHDLLGGKMEKGKREEVEYEVLQKHTNMRSVVLN